MGMPNPPGGPRDHESGLLLFLEPKRRARYRELLADPARRDRLRGKLAHLGDLDPRFLTKVVGEKRRPDALVRELRRRGAGDTCYLVSWDADADGAARPLAEAIEEIVTGWGGAYGVFVSCLPGRLAYFQGEDPGARYILERPS
jgi:hypothetical protein